ncbi:hypothetical protein [Adhaeretor mobilis]|uniref:Type II toxin-antitoxin system ParD family antitoxin n=1 Tax=Adhaeretor mobilis TaxID=1930276 RepID=A0A517MS64_9BACT|nr:hypothetical protein [Adhaeretor mobilis]QDS97721.1 hypothetical protein HG15A2_09860 [Adhaeretor mobilis]
MIATIAEEQARFLEAAIASGKYQDEKAALTEAVKLLQRRDEFVQTLDRASADIKAGNGIPAEEVFRKLEEQIARDAKRKVI